MTCRPVPAVAAGVAGAAVVAATAGEPIPATDAGAAAGAATAGDPIPATDAGAAAGAEYPAAARASSNSG